MAGDIFKHNSTGAAAIAASVTVPAGANYTLESITCHFSAAPTTSEVLTVKLDALAGAAYDTVLYSINPSTGGTTDILWQPSQPLHFSGGDVIAVAYPNTDTRTYGVQITVRQT